MKKVMLMLLAVLFLAGISYANCGRMHGKDYKDKKQIMCKGDMMGENMQKECKEHKKMMEKNKKQMQSERSKMKQYVEDYNNATTDSAKAKAEAKIDKALSSNFDKGIERKEKMLEMKEKKLAEYKAKKDEFIAKHKERLLSGEMKGKKEMGDMDKMEKKGKSEKKKGWFRKK